MADSSGDRKTALEGVKQRYGMVPNVIASMAESPAAVKGYTGLIDAMFETTFFAHSAVAAFPLFLTKEATSDWL